MAQLSTGTGNNSTTYLFDGTRVLKTDSRIEAIGQLDELVSLVELFANSCLQSSLFDLLIEELNRLMTTVAKNSTIPFEGEFNKEVSSQLGNEFKGFLIPESKLQAQLNYLRAVTRRVERSFIAMYQEQNISNPSVRQYLNELSDSFYTLAMHLK